MATLIEATLGHRELAASDISQDPVARKKIGSACALRMAEAWELCWWPLFMLTEERAFRDAWDIGTTYSENDEVYREDADGNREYYISLADANLANAPESSTSDWSVLTNYDHSIPWNHAGQTRIGTPKAVWTKDPSIYADAMRCPFKVNAAGILVPPMGLPKRTVFIEFRLPAPVLSYDKNAATRPYKAGEACYGEATLDSYLCLCDNTGTALTDTATWERQTIPAFLLQAVSLLAAADEWLAAGNQGQFNVFSGRGQKELTNQRFRKTQQVDQYPDDCMRA